MNILKELNIDRHKAKQLLGQYRDLQVQAMMFDLDIDFGTMTLVRKDDAKLSYIERGQELLDNIDGELPADHWLRREADPDSDLYQPKPWLDKWRIKNGNSDNDPASPEQAGA